MFGRDYDDIQENHLTLTQFVLERLLTGVCIGLGIFLVKWALS